MGKRGFLPSQKATSLDLPKSANCFFIRRLPAKSSWFFAVFSNPKKKKNKSSSEVDYFISHWWGTPFRNFCESVKRHAIHMSLLVQDTGGLARIKHWCTKVAKVAKKKRMIQVEKLKLNGTFKVVGRFFFDIRKCCYLFQRLGSQTDSDN